MNKIGYPKPFVWSGPVPAFIEAKAKIPFTSLKAGRASNLGLVYTAG